MKGRIVAVTIALVMSISAITANVHRSEAQQGTMPAGETHQAADQPTPVMPGAEETPVHGSDFNSSPVMFIENAGQWDDGARFQVWGGPAGTMWLAEDAIWITVLEPGETSSQVDEAPDPRSMWSPDAREDSAPRRGMNIKLSFVGANPHPRIETFDRLDTTVSYFNGNDLDQWRPDVPVWGGVRYADLYPGVDLELTSEAGQMVPRLAAQPGVNLDAVRLHVEGADTVSVDGDAMRLRMATGEIVMALFLVEGRGGDAAVQLRGTQSFDVISPYASPHTYPQPAITSPQTPADNPADLLYGTFLGVSSSNGWGPGRTAGISVDRAGSAYVMGITEASDFPTTPGAFDPSHNGYYDTIVVKLNPSGSGLTYATFLGGSDYDFGYGLAVDGEGSAYVTGRTFSSNFPATPGAFDPSYNGGSDAFAVKLNPAGNGLTYATFMGGSDNDSGLAIVVDSTGIAYVTGDTSSSGFPTTPGAFDTSFNGWLQDAFVIKLNPAGSGVIYATFLGGN